MDQFKNHLDTSCKGIQNWRYLADLNDVPLDEQRRWQSGERHSKTEKMFEVLACTNPDLLIGTLTQHLRNHQINNVAKYITSLHLDGKCLCFREICVTSTVTLSNRPWLFMGWKR